MLWHIRHNFRRWYPFILTLLVYGVGCAYIFWYDVIPFHIPCIFRFITGIPCPGCGMSRAFVFLLHGNLIDALYTNMLSGFLFIFAIALPIWLFIDAYKNENTLRRCLTIPWKPKYLIATLLIIGISWIWNIIRELLL